MKKIFKDIIFKRSYFKESNGAIAVMFALVLTPFILLTGIAIEISRSAYFQTQIAYALDASAIAGARYQTIDVQTNGNKFFLANFTKGKSLNISPTITLANNNTTVTVTASGSFPLYLGFTSGITNINLHGISTVQRAFNTVELALVLDNTGSMEENGKIEGLIAASVNLINILFQNQATSTHIAVSIVPYVATVNIGTNNSSWLADPATLSSFPDRSPWAGCVGAIDTGLTWDNDNPPGTGRRWPTYMAASTDGLFGSQSGNNDWKKNGKNLKVITPISGVNIGPNRSCGLAIQPLTNVKSDLINKINSMAPVPGGGTFGNLGLVWGWNTISPKWIGKWEGIDPKPYNTISNLKYVVIVTDGQNNWYAQPGYMPYGDPTAYGFSDPKNGNLSQGLLGTTDINNSRSYIDNRLSKLCTQIKSNNIQIFTVTFNVSDSQAKQIYQQCATKPENAFQANSAQQFYDIFANIANITQGIVIIK